MIIKEVSFSDSDDIFMWRNNLDTRIMAKSSAKIKKSTHDKWFKERFLNKNCFFYLGIDKELKIGVVRFDCNVKKKTSEVSINMNPQERGRKLSMKLLQMSINKFFKIKNYSLHSTIKKNNIASKKIFQGCNFKLFKSSENFDYYVLYHSDII